MFLNGIWVAPAYTTVGAAFAAQHYDKYPKGGDFNNFILKMKKIWNASRICVSSLRRGHANLLCIVPILVYVPPKRVQFRIKLISYIC